MEDCKFCKTNGAKVVTHFLGEQEENESEKNDLYLSMSTVPFLDHRLWNIEASKHEYTIGVEIHYCPFCGKELPNKITDMENN